MFRNFAMYFTLTVFRHLYFTSSTSMQLPPNSAVERIDLDGTNRIVLLHRNDSWFNGIVLLYKRREVCWCEIYSEDKKQISCMDLDGKNQRTVYNVTEHLRHISIDGFVVLSDRFYWSAYEYVVVTRA